MSDIKLKDQINWLEDQISVLEPSGSEAYSIPESILETLKNFTDNARKQPAFTDSEYRILLSALDLERKFCERIDQGTNNENGSANDLLTIMDSIQTKIKMLQYPGTSKSEIIGIGKKCITQGSMRKRIIFVSSRKSQTVATIPIIFDWRALEEDVYAEYAPKIENGIIFSGDYLGTIRVGDLKCELQIYTRSDETSEESGTWIGLDLYVGGVNTGYAYGRNHYPYDSVASADYKLGKMEYTDFQKAIEQKVIEIVQNAHYVKTDLVKKICEKLHVW